MRKPFTSSSQLTLAGLFLVASCSIIAEVDRTKIPQDAGTGPGDGGEATGGTSTGGMSGSSGTGTSGGGTSGTSGTTGQGGGGGDPGGMGGDGGDMGGAGTGGMGGDGGEPPMPECSDGTVDDGEECDDMDLMNGDGCDMNCDEETGWTCTGTSPSTCTPICGDGVDVGSAEACDDRNALSCGTCAGNAMGTLPGCTNALTPTAATGSIVPIVDTDSPADGDTFVLNDGVNPAITFEFDSNDSVTPSASLVDIDFTGASTVLSVSAEIIAKINGVGSTLLITAAIPGTNPGAALTNDRLSSLGNSVIGGTNNGSYTKSDMAGGLAGNCPMGTACLNDADCASLDCNNLNTCTAP